MAQLRVIELDDFQRGLFNLPPQVLSRILQLVAETLTWHGKHEPV
jgi:hypothetical protein